MRDINIKNGIGLNEIASILHEEEIIRSPFLFKVFAFITDKANRLRPGIYSLKAGMSYADILDLLIIGRDEEVTIQITEGATIFDIDALLAEKEVIKPGELISYDNKQPYSYEGYLFPDTYRFFRNTGPEKVISKMTGVFKTKTEPLLKGSEKDKYETIIIASLLEKEVPEYEDRRIVTGILLKRMRNNWLLQVDGAICYAKEPSPCYPLLPLDFKIDSPYNTYIHKGLPPRPIGNPGLQAIKAAIDPKDSAYWYYLSDPNTKKTIFSSTLEEHVLNKARYLR